MRSLSPSPTATKASPYSSYSSNAIESFWRLTDIATSDMPRGVDITTEIIFLNEMCHVFFIENRFKNLFVSVPQIGPDVIPAPKLLKGSGALSDRDLNYKQYRRLTAKSIRDLYELDHDIFLSHSVGESEWWVAPKYDGHLMIPDILHAFRRLVLAESDAEF